MGLDGCSIGSHNGCNGRNDSLSAEGSAGLGRSTGGGGHSGLEGSLLADSVLGLEKREDGSAAAGGGHGTGFSSSGAATCAGDTLQGTPPLRALGAP